MDADSEQEFTAFVHARSWALLRTARLLTADQHHAEDLVQAALTKLAGRWKRVDDPEAYVRKVMYHDQVSWWRRRGRIREDSAATAPDRIQADGAPGVDRRLDVLAALQRLGPRQRAVLVLRYYEDRTDPEIAELLGCSPGTVRSQAYRALARLRDMVPGLADDPDVALPAVAKPSGNTTAAVQTLGKEGA